jgi:hypothetical protein
MASALRFGQVAPPGRVSAPSPDLQSARIAVARLTVNATGLWLDITDAGVRQVSALLRLTKACTSYQRTRHARTVLPDRRSAVLRRPWLGYSRGHHRHH